jgi:hypothetical protein
MDMPPLPDKKQWLANDRATTVELERIAAHKLAAMTDEEAWRILQSLGPCPPAWRQQPNWSGLVEQQAFFHRRGKTISEISADLNALRDFNSQLNG